MDWISVKDQEPPKDGTSFLCYDPKQPVISQIYVVMYENGGQYGECDEDGGYCEAGGELFNRWEPTHWMPLPEPPNDEN